MSKHYKTRQSARAQQADTPTMRTLFDDVKQHLVSLDVELNRARSVTEVGLYSASGVLLDTLVKPVRRTDATRKLMSTFDTGHLKFSMFTDAPEFIMVQRDLEARLDGKVVVGWNVAGDLNVLNYDRASLGLPPLKVRGVIDLMRVYRAHRLREQWGNHSLTDILAYEGVPLRPGVAHRAGWDAQATMDLAKHYINLYGYETVVKTGVVAYEFNPKPKETKMPETNKQSEDFVPLTPPTEASLGTWSYKGQKDNSYRVRRLVFLQGGTKHGKAAFRVWDLDAREEKTFILWRFQNSKQLAQRFLEMFSK